MLRSHAEDLVMRRLRVVLHTTFGSYYHLQYDSLTININYQSISLQIVNPVFTTDTSQKQYIQKYPIVFFKADTLRVNHLNIRKLLLNQSLTLETILLNNPQLSILLAPNNYTDSTNDSSNQKIVKRNLIRDFELGSLGIEKGSICFIPLIKPNDTLFYGEKINIKVIQAKLKDVGQAGIYERTQLGNILFSMRNVQLNPPKSPYAYEMDQMAFNAHKNIIKCRKVNVYPEQSLLKMSKSSRYQKTFAEVAIGNLLLRGIDYSKIAEQGLNVQYAEIANTHFQVLRNKNKLLNKSDHKKSLQEAIRNIQMPLNIDTLNLRNIFLDIAVHFPKHEEPGTIQIHQINGNLLHLTNREHPEYPLELNVTANIMKTGKLLFQASFPLDKELHTYKANISSMPFEEWNQLISKIADVQIESGNIKSIVLTGKANSMETSGNILFEYRDLQATIFKRDKNGNLKKSTVLTYATNGILRMRNPENDEGIPVSKDYYFRREAYQGQIMLWVGGLIDGIEATLLNARLKKKVDQLEAKQIQERIK
jgi:hypothetical protein